ncbi:hypothetical protein W97_02746 [Coniosporium apollinis CBS 100218]|uniref:Uncharacterized protein n=1 Tax=Coniosporium apollinis (strain CBS 100218) TaxID=1168221 RepID=R7YNT1_CONA1|nr:uncharacterized protein W97_02746 [Coniosporium apollinis CBS 100218]EON63518.1 hypothetical protein W97_02746 [Coniosporium apollinis CBS 100218]
MASSAGSAVSFAFALFIISLLVLLLLRCYLPLRSTPAYLLVPVFLALALPASIVLLVPIDLASSAGTDTTASRGVWLPERALLVSWRITYWLTFALTWVILPLLGEYCDSGYREPRDRFIYSLRSNGRYQLMMLATGIAGAIYFFLQSGFNITNLKATVMALAYAWGLILAIYLMGHGLVALPRRLYRNADVSRRLRSLQSRAPKLHDKLMDAIEQLEQYEQQVAVLRQRKTGISREYREWIEELAEASALPESRGSSAQRPTNTTVPPVVTDRYLADLTRKLKRARHKKMRFISEWDNLVRAAIDTQAVLDSATTQRLSFSSNSTLSSFLSKSHILTPYTRHYLHTRLLPSARYVLAALFALASAAVIWSEITKSLAPKLSLIGLTIIHHPNDLARGRIGFAGQAIAAAWLSYMITCALLSVTEVKLWGNRALVRRGTYAESAAWYACQVAKLTVPLAYNFVTFVPGEVWRATAFHGFLGKLINLTPLGAGFSSYFPMLVLLPVAATMFGWYGKVKGVFGFGAVMDEEEGDEGGIGAGGWREGKALIEREISGGAGNALGLTAHRGDGDAEPAAPGPRPERYRDADSRRPLMNTGDEDDAGGEGSWFDDFSHRVRNTFDTAERPAWLEGLKKPKWMGGDEGGSSSGGRDGRDGLNRWFGGRSDGRSAYRSVGEFENPNDDASELATTPGFPPSVLGFREEPRLKKTTESTRRDAQDRERKAKYSHRDVREQRVRRRLFESFSEEHETTHQRPQQPRPREPQKHQHAEIRAKPASPCKHRGKYGHGNGADDSQQAPDGRPASQVVAFAATALPELEVHARLFAAEERVHGDGDEVVDDERIRSGGWCHGAFGDAGGGGC